MFQLPPTSDGIWISQWILEYPVFREAQPFNSTWFWSGILCFRRRDPSSSASRRWHCEASEERVTTSATRAAGGFKIWVCLNMLVYPQDDQHVLIGKMIGNHQIWYPIFRQTHFNPCHVCSCPNRWKALSSPRGTSIHLCEDPTHGPRGHQKSRHLHVK